MVSNNRWAGDKLATSSVMHAAISTEACSGYTGYTECGCIAGGATWCVASREAQGGAGQGRAGAAVQRGSTKCLGRGQGGGDIEMFDVDDDDGDVD